MTDFSGKSGSGEKGQKGQKWAGQLWNRCIIIISDLRFLFNKCFLREIMTSRLIETPDSRNKSQQIRADEIRTNKKVENIKIKVNIKSI